ncbi:MAG: hypothetical protein IPL77_21900 [Flavobacteriales bacterium]|nr:hypothetical protein [Flavobacteriales bacterium]
MVTFHDPGAIAIREHFHRRYLLLEFRLLDSEWSPTGQFIPGTVQGMTSIHFRKVTQTGSLQQACSASATRVCIVAGPRTRTSSTDRWTRGGYPASELYHACNANCDLTAFRIAATAHSNYNGPTNTFTKQGVGQQLCRREHLRRQLHEHVLQLPGTGYHFRLAASVPDDMNGIALSAT